MKKNLLIIGIILISIFAVQSLEASKKKAKKETVKVDPEFEKFWKEFKKAFIAKDIDKLCSMTNFPVVVGVQQYLVEDDEYVKRKEKQSKAEFKETIAFTSDNEEAINTLKTQTISIIDKGKYISCSFEYSDGRVELQFKLLKGEYKLVYFEDWSYPQ